jgi:RimJ/RimL family protein N-acetyltransferase
MTQTAVSKASTVNAALLSELNKDHLILTDDLLLRPIEIEDTADYALLLADANVMRFVGLEEGQVLSYDESTELVAGAVTAWTKRGWGRWSIFDSATGEFIGFCGYRCEDGMPELISIIHERYWGTGLAYEANRACLDYGFANLGFTEITSFTRPRNARARGLLAKLGAEFLAMVDFHGVEGAAYRLLCAPVVG